MYRTGYLHGTIFVCIRYIQFCTCTPLPCNSIPPWATRARKTHTTTPLRPSRGSSAPVPASARAPVDVALIVPGDVVFLRGGNVIPADGKWMEGDELAVDQAGTRRHRRAQTRPPDCSPWHWISRHRPEFPDTDQAWRLTP